MANGTVAKRKSNPARQTLEPPNPRVEALERTLAQQAARIEALEGSLRRLQDQSVERFEVMQAALYDMQAEVVSVKSNGAGSASQNAYSQLLRRLREMVRTHLPHNATVVVVNKGDEEMLKLYGRRGWHFPQTEDGTYAGYYPHSGDAAIAHLEWLRARGAEYFLLPNTANWWLKRYPEFREHLERRYQIRVRQEDTGVIFALREPSPWCRLSDSLSEWRNIIGQDPCILDWNSGSDLAARFPDHDIFSAADPNGMLPYLDKSIDVVAVGTNDERVVSEAMRVAKGAAVIVTNGDQTNQRVEIHWQHQCEEDDLPTASIIVTADKDLSDTRSCLVALAESLPSRFQGEIILVTTQADNGACFWLQDICVKAIGLRIIQPRLGRSLFETAVQSAFEATGEITIFLRSDTVVTPGWLLPILSTFRDHPSAGIVCPRVLFPDGAIKEAGGSILHDGALIPLGHGNRGEASESLDFLRQVDCGTTACLATRHSLFLESFDADHGSFERAVQEYCSQLNDMESRTYYQPGSVVVQSGSTDDAGSNPQCQDR